MGVGWSVASVRVAVEAVLGDAARRVYTRQMGTLREACKRLRFVGAFTFEPEGHRFSSQLKENGVSAGPDIVQHEAEPKKSHNC